MSVKQIKQAIDDGKVYFGIRQAIKNKDNIDSVFISKDAREETVNDLEDAGIEFIVLKPKSEMSKQLNLNFGCEVFSIAK